MKPFFLAWLWLLIYYLVCASSALVLRLKTKIEDELFRKLLHCILLGSMAVWVAVFPTWWQAALSSLVFAIVIYPLLYLAERIKGYSKTLTERNPGELKNSLIVVFFMFAVVIAVCWGLCQDRYLVLASVYAWGIGDCFAALIGKRYGKHKIRGKYLSGKKSWEGTCTMFLCSVFSVALILILRGGLSPAGFVLIPLAVGAVSAAAELFSRNGFDTIICPLSAMAALLPLTYLFGGFV